jgi:DNA-binding phage protein
MTLKLTPWDTSKQLQTRQDMILFLDACLAEAADDAAFIAKAAGVAARSPAMKELSEHDELREAVLLISANNGANILGLIQALGLATPAEYFQISPTLPL